MFLDNVPDNQGLDTLVIMPEHIADTCNLCPRHASIQGLQISWYMTAGFRDNLKSAFDFCKCQVAMKLSKSCPASV